MSVCDRPICARVRLAFFCTEIRADRDRATTPHRGSSGDPPRRACRLPVSNWPADSIRATRCVELPTAPMRGVGNRLTRLIKICPPLRRADFPNIILALRNSYDFRMNPVRLRLHSTPNGLHAPRLDGVFLGCLLLAHKSETLSLAGGAFSTNDGGSMARTVTVTDRVG